MINRLGILVIFVTAASCCSAQMAHDRMLLQSDSVTLAASKKYSPASFMKRLFLGKNYRTVWATPVTLPVFRIREMGFTIKELGGGQQTKSLHLLDASGHEWALRTIDKDVEKALPSWLQNTIAEAAVQDMVSAAHPYAPLSIPPLTKATGVVAAAPRYFVVPDDPALGEYRNLFKNTMCMLEDREPTPDGSATEDTEDLLKKMLEEGNVQIAGEAVLRARLIDMLVGDWDRHQDQWRWGFEKVAGRTYAYAIPRDRDQAFFYSNGLLVKLARAIALKHLVGFAKTTGKLKKLNAKTWNFDHLFLNGLNAADWNRTLQAFTTALPDSLIYAAVKRMPPEVYAIDGPLITQKLISRRNTLSKDALRYYRFIASQVAIVGTDKPDKFVIQRSKDSMTIQQFSGPGFSRKVYQRTFQRSETTQVTIIGLDGDDEFVEENSSRSRIRLVLDGGAGSDQYKLQNKHKTKISNSNMDAKSYLPVLKNVLRIKD